MDQKSLVPTPKAMNQGEIQLLKETYFKGANDNQISLGLRMAATYNLDPFLREIWFVDRIGMLVGRDGFLKVARANPEFRGLQSGVIYADQTDFKLVAGSEGLKEFSISPKALIGKAAPLGAWAIAYRAGCAPFFVECRFSDYHKPANVAWQTYPCAMIEKCAQVRALKLAFGISGLVSDVELDDEIRDSRTIETTMEMGEISAKKNGKLADIIEPAYSAVSAQSAKAGENNQKQAEIETKPAKNETKSAETVTEAQKAETAPEAKPSPIQQPAAPARISDDDFFGILNKIGRYSPEAKKWAYDLMGGKQIGQIDQPARQRIWAEITKVAAQKGIAL